MASDSRSPAVPAGGPSRPTASPRRRGALRRASGPGSGAESPSSWETGCGRKGGRPHALHATHVRGEPGAKPFVDDLLLGRGFVRSRAAPSLRSIESQPSTQGFVSLSRFLFPRGGTGARPPRRRRGVRGKGRRREARARGSRRRRRRPLRIPLARTARRPSPLLREPRRGLRATDWDGGRGGGWRRARPLSQGGPRAGSLLSFLLKSRSTSTPAKNKKTKTTR